MAPRFFLRMLLACIACGVLAVAAFNFVVDPLQFYRKARYRPFYSLEQRYQTPGLIRTHSFRSVVVGNSQANAFLVSDLKAMEQFPEPMNLALDGSTPLEQYQVADLALWTGKVQTVLWVLSDFAFMWEGPVDATRELDGFSAALYGKGVFAGLPYLFNKNTLSSSLTVFFTLFWDVPNYEDYQPERLNEKHIVKRLAKNLAATRPPACFPSAGEVPDRVASQVVKDRLNLYVERLVAAHPDKLFYFLVPPIPMASYSYYLACDREAFANKLGIDEYFAERLTRYPNARFFDFRTFPRLARDEGFVDFRHFSPEAAAEMLALIAKDEGRPVPETVALQRDRVLALAETAPPLAR